MSVSVSFSKTAPARVDTAVIFAAVGNIFGPAATGIDRDNGSLISRHLKGQKKFTGKAGQSLTLSLLQGAPWTRIIIVGTGEAGKATATAITTAGSKLYAALTAAGASRVAVFVEEPKAAGKPRNKTATDDGTLPAHLALGLAIKSYRFDKFKTGDKKAKGDDGDLDITIVTAAAIAAKAAFAALDAVREGVFSARDLANEPPNVLYPESFAKRVAAELKPLGVTVEIFDEKRLEKLGFGATIAVGQGSRRPPRVVVMRWAGKGSSKAGKKKSKPLAFVGKGVTFDTGGISIKPSAGMDEMKYDMCGAAAVVGLMKSLALRKSRTDVVGIIGLAENMPDGNACRPGDIVTTLSGQTVEILNTDAEGRLVLCDALTYIQRTYDPQIVIDLATLTGAIVVALGAEYAGAFCNNDDLWQKLQTASTETGEKIWRMPLDEAYRKAMEGGVGDLRNLSTVGSAGGSCTAAGYLEKFIDAGRAWCHLDIAAVAWSKGIGPTGTGWGVHLLDRLVAESYE